MDGSKQKREPAPVQNLWGEDFLCFRRAAVAWKSVPGPKRLTSVLPLHLVGVMARNIVALNFERQITLACVLMAAIHQ
jgi:hypothetical protein